MMMMMMSSLKLVLIFGAALGLCQFNAQNTNHLPSVVPQYNTNKTDQLTTPTPALQPNHGFDYFLFVLQWPAAFCNIQRSYNGQRKCHPDHVLAEHQNKFTVHGLWPQLYGAKSPLPCNTMRAVRDNDLRYFESGLLEYWPNLYYAQDFKSSMGFWRHQWNKHGSCFPHRFRNPRQYFQTTLNLAITYAESIYNHLNNRGIKPDGTTLRRLGVLRKVVMEVTRTYPIIKIGLNGSGDSLLYEIQLCVRKEDGFTLMDCEGEYIFAAP